MHHTQSTKMHITQADHSTDYFLKLQTKLSYIPSIKTMSLHWNALHKFTHNYQAQCEFTNTAITSVHTRFLSFVLRTVSSSEVTPCWHPVPTLALK